MNDTLCESPAVEAVPSVLRIWIFEDHECFRELLADYMRVLPEVEIVGTGDHEEQLFQAVDEGRVDLVMLDLHLQGPGGFCVMERLKQRLRPPAVLILSGQATPHSVSTAVRLGAVGYLQKTAPLEELLPAIERVRRGQTYFSEGPARVLAESMARGGGGEAIASALNIREVDLLTRLSHGSTVNEIAVVFQLSPFTIYKMRAKLMRKINAKNQRELVAYAMSNGLLNPALVH